MKQSPDNQINTFLIDISRIKWLVSCHGHLSSAQLGHWQATKQQPIIDQHPVEQMAYRKDIKENGYKSIFTNSWLVHQRNGSWIKGLGKNPQKSELVHWWQCLLSGATEPWPPWTPRNTCVYTRQPAQWHATGDVLTRLPAKTHKNRNACFDTLRSPFQQNIYTASDANWLSLTSKYCQVEKLHISQTPMVFVYFEKNMLRFEAWSVKG